MVLITRAPVRISFGGGGTDLPAYYERYGGLVISTTINYYVYTILTPGWPDGVQIISADYRALCERPTCEDLIWNGDLRLPKAITYYFNLRDGLTIFLQIILPLIRPDIGAIVCHKDRKIAEEPHALHIGILL